MAKGTGLIGNFKGKVGNTVGYKLSASNNGQTQGIRVYQPIVKNPKTAAQAEQRAKLLAVNATYRALKMVIDRGNEGLPYGNKSRLAWLKAALKSDNMPWFEKGQIANFPVASMLTKGSLQGLDFNVEDDQVKLVIATMTSSTDVSTIGKLSTAIKAGCPQVKEGDQITFVLIGQAGNTMGTEVYSIVIDSTSTEQQSKFTAADSGLTCAAVTSSNGGAVILSRLGDNGEHLRSNTYLTMSDGTLTNAPYDADSKAAAIASYQASAANNSDWAEESIQ